MSKTMNQALQNLKHLAIDWRMVLMASVLVVIALVFNIFSEGIFFSAENLYNIAQQTAVVGILATVMVLIIVTRHIDLSVGSVLGFVGVLLVVQPQADGFTHWAWVALAGTLCHALRDISVRFIPDQVPSTLVTLGTAITFL